MTKLEDLPPEEAGPSLDELVDFGGETTDAFIARTGSRQPAPMAAGDAVPVFRADLKIEKGAAAGLFEVTEPGTGRHFTLYEFELSIARMLDGRRHASGVIENGVRLGIPVDLDGLNKFVRQLWRYGFLAEPGAPSVPEGEETGWGEREKWDEATRTLFQTGLRLMRQGRPQDAGSYFQAVLDADPGNDEATELLAAVERGEALTALPIGRRAGRGSPGPARGRRRFALAALALGAASVAAGWFLAGRSPARSAPAPAMAAPQPKPVPPPPPPAWRTAAVQRREHPALGAITAPGGGVIVWRRANGDPVAKGERIGVLRTEASGPRSIDPTAAARIKELEALAATDPVYRDFLEKERRAASLKRSTKGVRELPLIAPAAGVLSLAVESRARVERDAQLATVVDGGAWVVDAFLDGEPPPVEAACELRGDAIAERVTCRLEAVRPREGGCELLLTAAAADVPWLGASRSLRVRVAPPGTPEEPAARRQEAGTP